VRLEDWINASRELRELVLRAHDLAQEAQAA
jgi:hypothetical protein